MPDSPDQPAPIDVRKVARLARLAVPDDQVDAHARALKAVLGYMDRLRSLDLSGVEPMPHVGDETNRLAPDLPGPTLPLDVLMSMAPQTHPPFVRIPKVLGADGGAS